MKKEVQFVKDYGVHKKGSKWKASRDLMAMVVKSGSAMYVEDIPKKKPVSKSKKTKKE